MFFNRVNGKSQIHIKSALQEYKMAKKNNKSKKKEDASGIFIPAGTLIGLGIGLIINQVAGGVILGLGIGFLIMAIVKVMKKK